MKLERLISMIYMLLNNEVISASALAEKYQVSQRTIYRDIDAICAAGIPVVSYQGVHGGYGIMETYKMDRSLLGTYDVESLITVLHSLSSIFKEEQTSETIRKLQTIQRDKAGPSLTLEIGSRYTDRKRLQLLREAIKNRTVVAFTYVNGKSEKMKRKAEPVCLMYYQNHWYLYAYCLSRDDYRQFKLTRMLELEALPETCQREHEMPNHPRQNEDDFGTGEHTQTVELRFSKSKLARALDIFHSQEKSFNTDGSLTIVLPLHSSRELEWLFPVLLSFAEHVEIVEPAAYRELFREKLQRVLRSYEQSATSTR